MYVKACAIVVLWLAALPAFAAVKIQHWTLGNGARVYFVETHELPVVQVSAVFDAGSARDTDPKSGLAMLTNRMLGEGAGDWDATRIANRFEDVGAEFGSSADRDMASVSLRTLSQRDLREPALETLAQILRSPSFPEASLQRERARALIDLQRVAQSPDETAARLLGSSIYGDHPYGNYLSGSEAGLKAITRDDLVAFHQRYYVGANALLAIVGDIDEQEARRIAERLVGKLPRGEAAPALPEVSEARRPVERLVRFPSQQSHIRLGAPGMARNDPDYFPLFVGNYILGGSGLVSRLAEEIREKQGLSYSVYSYFDPRQVRGPFVIGTQTKNAQRGQALKLMRQTLADFIAKGPTPEELAAAKKHLTGSFPLRIDSNGKILDYLVVIGFYRLPLTYLDEFIPRIEAVTAEQVQAAFKRHIAPERMVTVIVGGS